MRSTATRHLHERPGWRAFRLSCRFAGWLALTLLISVAMQGGATAKRLPQQCDQIYQMLIGTQTWLDRNPADARAILRAVIQAETSTISTICRRSIICMSASRKV